MSMFIATIDTPSFNFMAAGHTAVEAKAALMHGWKQHCKTFKSAEPDYIVPDDLTVTEIRPGECLRDYETISHLEKPARKPGR